MRFSLRAKLTAIVAVAAGAFILVIVAGSISAALTERQLETIRERYLPIIEIGPRLEAQFEHLRRGLQDATAARDAEMLQGTRATFEDLRRLVATSHGVIEPTAAAALMTALDDYYRTASSVSSRLISGETGEAVLESVTAMQAAQARATERLAAATAFDRTELTRAFDTAARAESTAGRLRFATAIGCLGLVVVLSVWLGRSMLRSLATLTEGLARFGRGDLARPIPTTGDDELQDVAREANQMAASLERFGRQRDESDWLKGALVGLAEQIRGELAPADLAARALRFLTRYLELPAGALYGIEHAGELVLLAAHGAGEPSGGAGAPRFRRGEGLVGQAALREDVTLVTDVPPGYFRVRSGLGQAEPCVIALLPLLHLGQVSGVLELASFRQLRPRDTEALASIRETLGVAIAGARARDDMRDLLAESRRQTMRLREQEDELRAANAQLEKKAVELTTISSYKSQFLTNMSHELRTPLNSMLLLSSLLTENAAGNLTEKQIEFARTIHVAGQDLLSLINQVLDLGRIEAGKQDIQIGTVALRRIVATLRLVFEPLAQDKGLELVVEIDADAPETIETDGRRLEQILKNLLGNAIKFTDRGRVTLHVGRPAAGARVARGDLRADAAVAFAVSDTGIGVAPEDQERIFFPFEQVGKTPDKRFGGTGLGLGISRELAGLLGGELQLESTPGSGSRFTCVLPLDRAASTTGERALPMLARAAPAPRDAGEAARTPCVLAIEDDPVFTDVLAAIVRERGLDFLKAADGQTGLRLARERRPAGIVLDVRLPDIDGWRVIEELRAHPSTSGIPVHFVSALNAPDRGLSLGAVGFLMKPTTRSDLRRVVDLLVPSRADAPTRVLVVEPEVGDASLTRSLAREGVEVDPLDGARDVVGAIERGSYGCLVLDLAGRDVAGLDVLRDVRERFNGAAPPIVVYASRVPTADERAAIEATSATTLLEDGASREHLVEELRRFIVRLAPARAPVVETVSGAAATGVRLDGRKVLVVDDDMRTVYALSALLRGKGAEVYVADTGLAGLSALEGNPDIEIVLMDMMMPEMDGYEAMRRIRREARFAALPIVALTAQAMKDDAQRCLDAGASAYLQKPVDADRLLGLIGARLSRDPDEQRQGGAA
ncbi:MAG TPA: response regulator [Polyangia bacterium]|nr:response regulator [Polyangia bacterium]